jgi:quercetin dioxygenase-like cupin family protein
VRGGGSRATATLKAFAGPEGGIWNLIALEAASTGLHQHQPGAAVYGECVITLAGELDDEYDDGTPIRLRTGDVMFHAPGTIHEATAERFWLGIIHQPEGCIRFV